MIHSNIPLSIHGHVKIEDDLGNVYVDQDNAIHPQNIARVVTRALAKEDNYHVSRIAFGNGGTEIDAAFNITFKTPNDGQPPDIQTWESRLYNETYSEIVDESNTALLGTDQGSAGPRVGTRPGGGADPTGDPVSVPHVSGPGTRSRELGLTSEVLILAVLNPNEPTGQFVNDNQLSNLNSSFTFDELGIFTTGLQAAATSGSQDVDVGNKTSTDLTNLTSGVAYKFSILVDQAVDDGSIPQEITVVVNDANTTYGDLCEAINTGTGNGITSSPPLPGLTTVSITDNTFGTYLTINGAQTYGFLRYTSGSSGITSKIRIASGPNVTNDLFANLNGTISTPGLTDGSDKGVQNNAIDSVTEQERLLTHLIFAPVIKTANRTLTVTYTLTVSVART